MNEKLLTRENQKSNITAQPLATRAVALCEGCPMAALCAAKNTGECPPGLNDTYNASESEERSAPGSYMKELLDDSVPIVRATLRPVVSYVPLPKPAPQPHPKQPMPTPRTRLSPKPPSTPKGETMAETLADIVVEMLSVRSLKTARAKK